MPTTEWLNKYESIKDKLACKMDLDTHFTEKKTGNMNVDVLDIGAVHFPHGGCVKRFSDIEQCVEFGAYIQPENYFVSCIFATDAQLKAATQSGLAEQINSHLREQLTKHHSPIQGIKDCCFSLQEECDKKYDRNWCYHYK